jgi:hypothetical protein
MPTRQEILQPQPDADRHVVGRTRIDRDVQMYFLGQDGVHACRVRRDKSRRRTSSERFEYPPSEFGISFDDFRTMRCCRLIWRDGDFVDAEFES